MSSSIVKRSIVQIYPHLKKSIEQVQQDVLGYAPPSLNNARTGYQFAKKQMQAVYLNQYYEGHKSIDPSARKVNPGWRNYKEERRDQKLFIMRRNGKGPPKKGAGKKGKKKGGK